MRDVVQALRDTNELENTFIFYTSDNGYHFGEHRIAGGKATPFEESIRFPLIVRGPGVPAGVSREELVSNVDLLPTFLDLIGNAPDPMVDGRSLLPLLAADPPREPWRQSLVIESVSANRNHGVPPFEGIRTSRYKLVSYRDGERELYDLAVDPAERINVLATTEPSVVAELEDRLAALFECKGATCRSLEDRPFETQ